MLGFPIISNSIHKQAIKIARVIFDCLLDVSQRITYVCAINRNDSSYFYRLLMNTIRYNGKPQHIIYVFCWLFIEINDTIFRHLIISQ
jgi:hypothetical protein